MGFLKRDDDGGSQQASPAEQELAPENTAEAPHAGAYQAGSLAGIPESGRERIERMKKDLKRGFFTSDLSINEFLLVKQSGFEPLGLVLGSSIYHIGFQQANWSRNQEMGILTQAMYHARELAMTRMEEEADQLGADGVVGVRLDIGRYEWGADLAEFIAVGTAVKHRGGELHRAPNGRPFTSDLSGQDFSTLLRAGYRPVGLVMGNCVYHVAHQGLRAAWKQVGRNQEMPNYTQALYEARELAMERMQNEADELQAAGIVGAQIIERSHGWGSHVIEFFAVGTGVVPISVEHEIEKPELVLPLLG
ncbi:MAG: heavy metal-binding domain-containing protein [Solirubrobacteraceae bacterium]